MTFTEARGRLRRPGLEPLLRRELARRGLRFRVHRRVGHWTADLVFPTQQVAVFVDDCHRHGCPRHSTAGVSWWARTVARTRELDRQIDRALRRTGWAVVRVWEHEAPARAAARVERAVRRRTPLLGRRFAETRGDG